MLSRSHSLGSSDNWQPTRGEDGSTQLKLALAAHAHTVQNQHTHLVMTTNTDLTEWDMMQQLEAN